MGGLTLDVMMKALLAQNMIDEAMALAKEAVEVYEKAGHKKGQALSLHAHAGLMLDVFFKACVEQLKEFKVSGYNPKNYKPYDMKPYEEAIEMMNTAWDIFVEIGDKEGQELI